jgi:hypothetical protein
MDDRSAEVELEAQRLARIGRAAEGEYRAVRDADGNVITDNAGEPVLECIRPGDWKAAAWLLERSNPRYRPPMAKKAITITVSKRAGR